ncbi:MAG: MOSC domain-containing protein [Bacteroidetes bacterium]|nr:MOSC domain-containing protein [Bacteroidota bacterium]
MNELSPLNALLNTLPQKGRVEWIGVRPARDAPVIERQQVKITKAGSVEGDRFSGGEGSKRQVTLIQAEHLSAIASLLHRPEADPALLRRNIVVSGINLLALKDKSFYVGTVHLRFTGHCQPCSKMERNFGPGGYNAVRGHGGITATVLGDGSVSVGDAVIAASEAQV